MAATARELAIRLKYGTQYLLADPFVSHLTYGGMTPGFTSVAGAMHLGGKTRHVLLRVLRVTLLRVVPAEVVRVL
jgi:hypothetical protein